MEFEPWPKIARLRREIIISEKINGTNAAVVIARTSSLADEDGITTFTAEDNGNILAILPDGPDESFVVFAQSRTRFIIPADDNYGFAKWVQQNAQGLVDTLGEGRHFGEWWGSGIQGGYGAAKGQRYFSLFNTTRWSYEVSAYQDITSVPNLRVVPVLYQGAFTEHAIEYTLNALAQYGSVASPGYTRPEGVVIFHTASNSMFKITLQGDEAPKSASATK